MCIILKCLIAIEVEFPEASLVYEQGIEVTWHLLGNSFGLHSDFGHSLVIKRQGWLVTGAGGSCQGKPLVMLSHEQLSRLLKWL